MKASPSSGDASGDGGDGGGPSGPQPSAQDGSAAQAQSSATAAENSDGLESGDDGVSPPRRSPPSNARRSRSAQRLPRRRASDEADTIEGEGIPGSREADHRHESLHPNDREERSQHAAETRGFEPAQCDDDGDAGSERPPLLPSQIGAAWNEVDAAIKECTKEDAGAPRPPPACASAAAVDAVEKKSPENALPSLREVDDVGHDGGVAAARSNDVVTSGGRAPAIDLGRGTVATARPTGPGRHGPVGNQHQEEDLVIIPDAVRVYSVQVPVESVEEPRRNAPNNGPLIVYVQEPQNNAPVIDGPAAQCDPRRKKIMLAVVLGLLVIGAVTGIVIGIIIATNKGGKNDVVEPTISVEGNERPSPCQSTLSAPRIQVSAPDPSTNLTFVSGLGLCEDIASHNGRENIAIHGDTAIVGAPFNNNGRGSAFVYARADDGEWTRRAELVAPGAVGNGRFGWSVAMHGDAAVVGAYLSDEKAGDSGSAHVFLRKGGDWTHASKLHAPDRSAGDNFGFSVGMHGGDVVVGALQDDDGGKDSGSAHVFRAELRDGLAVWTHRAKLVAPDGAAGDRFGVSVGMYGDTVVVGADGDDDSRGSAYLFVQNDSTWEYKSKIVAPDGAVEDRFGVSVGIHSETVIVGAPETANGEEDGSGSAHLFVRNDDGDAWTHRAKLVAPDGLAVVAGTFGFSVDTYGDAHSVVGSVQRDENGAPVGVAHFYVRRKRRAKLLAPKIGSGKGWSVAVHNGTVMSGSKTEVYSYTYSG